MNRRVVLLVLLLADDDRLAAAAVLAGLARVAPGRRVAVVDGQAPVRTLTPLTTATHLTGVPHLPARVAAQDLYPRLGHHLYGVQIQLELDDRTPEGYVVACVWGNDATRTAADLGDYAAFVALDCPVEVQHYFLGATSGGLRARPPEIRSGVSVQAWLHVDPATIAERLESVAEGKFPPLAGAVPVDLNDGLRTGVPDTAREVLSRVLASSRSAASVAESVGPLVVVDAAGGGDFVSLAAAVSAASPGSRIVVRPGVYQGTVVMDKSLDIIGDGDRDTIIVTAVGGHVLEFTADHGQVANLTLRQQGGGSGNGVDISRGRLELTGCDITSNSWAGVAVYGDATPLVRGNHIHHAKASGVIIEQGAGVLQDNDIHNNAKSGVYVGDQGAPMVRENRIHKNNHAGVAVREQGAGVYEDNDIYDNVLAGVFLREQGGGVFRRNEIHSNGGAGVNVYGARGTGVFQDNDLRGNSEGPWAADTAATELIMRSGNQE